MKLMNLALIVLISRHKYDSVHTYESWHPATSL